MISHCMIWVIKVIIRIVELYILIKKKMVKSLEYLSAKYAVMFFVVVASF